jgi:chloride channel 7
MYLQVEMSQDINMIIPVMITVLVAKWTADNICKPLYKFQLDGKSLPYLDQDPVIALKGDV